jgi:hypothetical protein
MEIARLTSTNDEFYNQESYEFCTVYEFPQLPLPKVVEIDVRKFINLLEISRGFFLFMERKRGLPKDIQEAAGNLGRFIADSPSVGDTLRFYSRTDMSIPISVSQDGKQCIVGPNAYLDTPFINFHYRSDSGSFYTEVMGRKGLELRRVPGVTHRTRNK